MTESITRKLYTVPSFPKYAIAITMLISIPFIISAALGEPFFGSVFINTFGKRSIEAREYDALPAESIQAPTQPNADKEPPIETIAPV